MGASGESEREAAERACRGEVLARDLHGLLEDRQRGRGVLEEQHVAANHERPSDVQRLASRACRRLGFGGGSRGGVEIAAPALDRSEEHVRT